MEAIGTSFLVLAYGLTNDAFAIGFVLSALIFGGMHISGAHFNPAVTFAYWMKGSIKFSTFLGYTLSQLLGAFAASGALLMLTNSVFYVEPPTATYFTQQASIEAIFTFLLAFAYIGLIPAQATKASRINAIGIGITLTAALIIGENISGAVYNPAISIGSSIIDFLAIKGASFSYILLYSAGPLLGAAVAGLLCRYLDDES
jgi:glycerol uptake facilitator-like aquaporin